MSSSSSLRTLKIKTSVVDRILKELASYKLELIQTKNTIAEIEASNDHSKLKQWRNVLGETQGMVPDTASRLSNAMEDLTMLVEDSLHQDEYEGTQELRNARTVLSSASEALEE